jgi:hypothetical protein
MTPPEPRDLLCAICIPASHFSSVIDLDVHLVNVHGFQPGEAHRQLAPPEPQKVEAPEGYSNWLDYFADHDGPFMRAELQALRSSHAALSARCADLEKALSGLLHGPSVWSKHSKPCRTDPCAVCIARAALDAAAREAMGVKK